MARVAMRTLWTVEVRHAFFGGACDALAFTVPPATQRALAGAHLLARERDGRLFVMAGVDAADQPLLPLAGLNLVFGLQPRDANFALYTLPPAVADGDTPLWDNAADPDAIGAPRGVRLTGERPRIEPRSPQRPLALRLFDGAGAPAASATLQTGDESWTPRLPLTRGDWRVEEQFGAEAPSSWTLRADPELRNAWGVLSLTVDAGHVANGQDFVLDFDARSETLRYYVVAERYAEADFAQVQVVDAGFAAEARPAITFDRVAPADFDASHLDPALLDPTGSARIALFEARTAVARRARGPSGLELHRNGDVLVGNLPQPGAERHDAQFVVHLGLT